MFRTFITVLLMVSLFSSNTAETVLASILNLKTVGNKQ